MFRSSVVKALGLLVMAGMFAVTDSGSGSVSWLSDAYAQPKPNIRNTKHNLSSASSNTVKSTKTSEICVYCHTPHGAGAEAPLWNRALPTSTYTTYTSETLDQTASSTIAAPSKLCLSCHDGSLAVGSVSNAPGSGRGNTSTSQIPTNLTNDKIALDTAGGSDGYTRLIGTNLKNDHPIAINFNNTIAGLDRELRTDAYNENTGAGAFDSGGVKRIFNKRALGVARPHLVGFDTPNVQCPTCHDPHLGSVTDSGTLTGINNKFLRLNRFQLGSKSKSDAGNGDSTAENPFDPATDQICIACHTREGKAWTESAHANSVVANEAYTSTAATLRQFPTNTKVWNAGCLNCHDTHTKTGARRLLREGVSGTDSAIENTCYQCHNTSGNSAVAGSGNTGLQTPTTAQTVQIPDIATEFTRTVKMPIAKTPEVHEIRNADFEECPKTLGGTVNNPPVTSALGTKCNSLTGTNANRHAECTDCHNPHRVRRGAKFYTAAQVNPDATATADQKRRTHIPADDDPNVAAVVDSSPVTDGLLGNVVSGALRGAWGVEPNYGTINVDSVWLPSAAAPTFEVKKGDPGASQTYGKAENYLTREYQLCFKCHSNYAYDGTPPALGNAGTPASANGYNTNNSAALYTNQAGEFAVYAKEFTGALSSLTGTHQCEAGGDTTCTPIGASWDVNATNASTINHRSWHPVMYPTGRTATERGGTNNNFREPFRKLGIQTMHCSDCHGHDSTWTAGSGPDLGEVQGPHGSSNNFLLRGSWDSAVNNPGSPGFCGNCHNPGNSPNGSSGWGGQDTTGHSGDTQHGSTRCGRCHVALPHGWKNKAFLVNLNCVGGEGGAAAGVNCSSSVANTRPWDRGPYYVGAVLRIRTWNRSGNWSEGSCGTSSSSGKSWMTNGTC